LGEGNEELNEFAGSKGLHRSGLSGSEVKKESRRRVRICHEEGVEPDTREFCGEYRGLVTNAVRY